MEWYWQVKPKNSKKKLSQCHFVHHKTHWIDPGANPGRGDNRPATNRLSHGTARNTCYYGSVFHPQPTVSTGVPSAEAISRAYYKSSQCRLLQLKLQPLPLKCRLFNCNLTV
jgi:hypothetical protein